MDFSKAGVRRDSGFRMNGRRRHRRQASAVHSSVGVHMPILLFRLIDPPHIAHFSLVLMFQDGLEET